MAKLKLITILLKKDASFLNIQGTGGLFFLLLCTVYTECMQNKIKQDDQDEFKTVK